MSYTRYRVYCSYGLPEIIPFEVERETECYQYNDIKIVRELKGIYYHYFNTLEDAKAWILQMATQKLDTEKQRKERLPETFKRLEDEANKNIEDAEKTLARIKEYLESYPKQGE